MPRTTKKPKPDPAPRPEPQPAAVNGPPGEVLTLAEAAAFLQLGEQDVLRMVWTHGLPARQVRTQWRFPRKAVQDWLDLKTTRDVLLGESSLC